MNNLNYQLKHMCRTNRDGSFATQANRIQLLNQMANQLSALGYTHMNARSLKTKHVDALVKHWKCQNLSVGTVKNRLAILHWWARKINKPDIAVSDSSRFDLPSRSQVSHTTNKAINFTDEAFAKRFATIKDEYVRLSIRLQAEFGLRREESIKFQPRVAIQGDAIFLKAAWTKGGRARVIPITSQSQIRLLEEARQVAKGGALIPPHRNYAQQLHRYERQLRNAGLKRLHGLRHAYVQRRYLELAGWPCPVAGGTKQKDLTPEQVIVDKDVRLQLSFELGHSREGITKVYLGG